MHARDNVHPLDLAARLDLIDRRLDRLLDAEERLLDLIEESGPIAKEVMGVATDTLMDAEQRGWFAAGREALRVAEAAVGEPTPEESRATADAVISLLDTVQDADLLPVLDRLARTAGRRSRSAPVGPMGVLKALRDPDVQKGLGVALDLLGALGRASTGKRALTPARPARKPRPAPQPRTAPAPAPAVAVAAGTIAGIPVDDLGYLVDPCVWTEDLVPELAKAVGVDTLTDTHWTVLRFARKDWEETGKSPNLRRITLETGLDTKALYALWPVAPGKCTAKVAGIPKPTGCL